MSFITVNSQLLLFALCTQVYAHVSVGPLSSVWIYGVRGQCQVSPLSLLTIFFDTRPVSIVGSHPFCYTDYLRRLLHSLYPLTSVPEYRGCRCITYMEAIGVPPIWRLKLYYHICILCECWVSKLKSLCYHSKYFQHRLLLEGGRLFFPATQLS